MPIHKPITRFLFAENDPLPEYDAALSEYVFGTSGLHRRARRPGLEAVVSAAPPERLLQPVEPYVRMHAPRVPRTCSNAASGGAAAMCHAIGSGNSYCKNKLQIALA